MDKKKILAVMVFLLMGFFMFTFANPSNGIQEGIQTPEDVVDNNGKTTETTPQIQATAESAPVVDTIPPVITLNGTDEVIRT